MVLGLSAALPAAPLSQPLLLLHLAPWLSWQEQSWGMLWHKDPSVLTTKNSPSFLCERLKLLSPKTKQGM